MYPMRPCHPSYYVADHHQPGLTDNVGGQDPCRGPPTTYLTTIREAEKQSPLPLPRIGSSRHVKNFFDKEHQSTLVFGNVTSFCTMTAGGPWHGFPASWRDISCTWRRWPCMTSCELPRHVSQFSQHTYSSVPGPPASLSDGGRSCPCCRP